MTESKLLWRKESGVATITFNNPQRLNAASLDMWEGVARLLEQFAEDDEVRVLVFTGAGDKAFVSGADISKFASERASREATQNYNVKIEQTFVGVHEFPKPTIAMIRGYCLGGGLGLATCCDLRICSDNSRFSVPAAKLGLGYGYMGVKRLADIVGPAYAKEIFYTARQFDACEAYDMGLVNRVVPATELQSYVASMTATICGNAPLTIRTVKAAAGEIYKDEAGRDVGRIAEMVDRCFASSDYTEGRTAFMEKRKPNFTGR